MRKNVICLAVFLFLIFTVPLSAEIGPKVISPDPAGQEAICEGPPILSSQNPAAVCGVLIQDMMQVMTDSLALQERVLKGLKPEEKKLMLKEIESMRSKLERLRSEARFMIQGWQAPL